MERFFKGQNKQNFYSLFVMNFSLKMQEQVFAYLIENPGEKKAGTGRGFSRITSPFWTREVSWEAILQSGEQKSRIRKRQLSKI